MSFPPPYPYNGQYPQYNGNQAYGNGQMQNQQFQGQGSYVPQQQQQQQFPNHVQHQQFQAQQYQGHPQQYPVQAQRQQQHQYQPQQQFMQDGFQHTQDQWHRGNLVNAQQPGMSQRLMAEQQQFQAPYVSQGYQQQPQTYQGNGVASHGLMQGQYQSPAQSPHLQSPHLLQQGRSPHLQQHGIPSPHMSRQSHSPYLQQQALSPQLQQQQSQSPHFQQQQMGQSPHMQQHQMASPQLQQQIHRQSPHLQQQSRTQSPQLPPQTSSSHLDQQRNTQSPQVNPQQRHQPKKQTQRKKSQTVASPIVQSPQMPPSQVLKPSNLSVNSQPQRVTSPQVPQKRKQPQPPSMPPPPISPHEAQGSLVQSPQNPQKDIQQAHEQELPQSIQPQDLEQPTKPVSPQDTVRQQPVRAPQNEPPPQFVSMEHIQPQFLMKEPVFEPPAQEIDMRLLSMNLADEYISQALNVKNTARLRNTDYDVETYEKLMTTGLRFLQVNIKEQTWLVSPREEATLQLRYALLMFEETDNISDIEIALNRGIKFCSENNLLDLKYSMQHLLIRTMLKSNAKIALKSLDDAIEEVTLSRHVPWIYAFRFLRAELVNTIWNQPNQRAAIKSLRAICELAKERKDSAVQVLACTQLAMLHLRLRESESIVEAQRALTEARSQQLSPQMESLPQLNAYMLTADLVCELEPFKHANATPKAQALQQFLSNVTGTSRSDEPFWSDSDPCLHLPLQTLPEEINLFMETGGIFQTSSTTGQTSLTLTWLSKSDVLMWGWLLAASAEQSKTVQKDSADQGFTKDRLLQKALQMLDKNPSRSESANLLKSLLLIQQAFTHADRSDWSTADRCLNEFREAISRLPPLIAHKFRPYQSYLAGAIQHGGGDTPAAMHTYSELFGHLGVHSNKGVVSVEDVFAVLAGCSMLMILSDATHPEAHRVSDILEKLAAYFPESNINSVTGNTAYTAQNPNLRSAHAFVTSIFPPHHAMSTSTSSVAQGNNPSIIHTKQHLQSSLSLAKSTGNAQLLMLSLSYLCGRFFVGTTGEQTTKSMLAARDWARETRSKLWMSVCDGMLTEIMERQGRSQEAERWRVEGERAVGGMEGSVRSALGL